MAKIEAVERIAHGMACDNSPCDVIIPMRNSSSMPTGYYINAVRVTDANCKYVSEQLFFHNKDCMLNALQWQFSALTNERVFDEEHLMPKRYPQRP